MIQSYYIFSFACGDIQWSGQGFETAVLGYNSHGDYFSNHPANGFPDIGQIVSCTRRIIQAGRRRKRQDDGNVMISGDTANPMPANPEIQINVERCNGIANFDDVNIPDITALAIFDEETAVNVVNEVDHCPPTRAQIDISTLFIGLPEKDGDCFRSRMIYTPDGETLQRDYNFISVCCYDANRYIFFLSVNKLSWFSHHLSGW